MAKERIKRISRVVNLQRDLKRITSHRLAQAQQWQDELEERQKKLLGFLDNTDGTDRLAELADQSLLQASIDHATATRDQKRELGRLVEDTVRLRHAENLLEETDKSDRKNTEREVLNTVIERVGHKDRSVSDKTEEIG